ncbi:MAG: hypothetical protein F6K40_01220 [Okeania sp. SIO3I5]|nr:hypothetical protein [Okeania sp. SIO3I5]
MRDGKISLASLLQLSVISYQLSASDYPPSQKKVRDGKISGISLNMEKRMPSHTLLFFTRHNSIISFCSQVE